MIVWVVGHRGYEGEVEVIAVASSEERGRQLAGEAHDERRDHKVTTALQWTEEGVSWSIARKVRYEGLYVVEEFPVL